MSNLAGQFALPQINVFGNVSVGTPYSAGTQYQSPGPIAIVPDVNQRPRADVNIERIYLPIAVQTSNSATALAAQASEVVLTAKVRGVAEWIGSFEIPLTRQSGNPGFSTGNGLAADDLINPLGLALEDQIELWFAVSYDVDLTGWEVSLSAQQAAPSIVTPSIGAAFYRGLE